MCLIAFAWRAHRDFPLVVAGNRDEFFARPTAAADWWTDADLLAGRDLKAGGTWMGDTAWPKVDHAIDGMRAALASSHDPDDLGAALFSMLADRTIAEDDRLPRTGIPLASERALSAPFIRLPGYGTRASTVLIVDANGKATFVERRCEPDAPRDERRFTFGD